MLGAMVLVLLVARAGRHPGHAKEPEDECPEHHGWNTSLHDRTPPRCGTGCRRRTRRAPPWFNSVAVQTAGHGSLLFDVCPRLLHLVGMLPGRLQEFVDARRAAKLIGLAAHDPGELRVRLRRRDRANLVA